MAQGMLGKVVLLTGAAGGLGAVYAKRLASEGAIVVAADIDSTGAQSVRPNCR